MNAIATDLCRRKDDDRGDPCGRPVAGCDEWGDHKGRPYSGRCVTTPLVRAPQCHDLIDAQIPITVAEAIDCGTSKPSGYWGSPVFAGDEHTSYIAPGACAITQITSFETSICSLPHIGCCGGSTA